jgi:hypothetical protein
MSSRRRLKFLLSHFPKLCTLHMRWLPDQEVQKYLFHLKNAIRKLNLIADINIKSRDLLSEICYSNYNSDDNFWDNRGKYINSIDLCIWFGKNTPELLTNFMTMMNSLAEY